MLSLYLVYFKLSFKDSSDFFLYFIINFVIVLIWIVNVMFDNVYCLSLGILILIIVDVLIS